MKKTIYKITNLINGKSYIGQTNNFSRRIQEHKSMGYEKEGNKLLYKAFEKYGIDNFIFEMIEETEEYNEREKYWIKYYNSYENGYNMTIGGDDPPIKYGDDNDWAKLNQTEFEEICDLIKSTKLSFKEIAQQFQVHPSSVVRINQGKIRKQENLIYPLRVEDTNEFKAQRALEIIHMLQFSDYTQKEIAEKFGVGRSTITAINNGQNHRQDNIEYPIRGKGKNKSLSKILMLNLNTNKILQEFQSINEAAKFLNRKNLETTRTYLSKQLQKNGIAYGYKWLYK